MIGTLWSLREAEKVAGGPLQKLKQTCLIVEGVSVIRRANQKKPGRRQANSVGPENFEKL